MAFNWKCPFCNHNATITDDNYSFSRHEFNGGKKYKNQLVKTIVIKCPNNECKEYVLNASLHDRKAVAAGSGLADCPAKKTWRLIPNVEMKVFPDYVPTPIIKDYEEACLINHLSPKASATLSRRCLQGMIRDFWNVKKARLVDEIEALQEKVEPLTWSAIDAVRKLGNIGAHMEKEINYIIDVDSEEASLLIGLIEMLITDWYVAKHEREQQLAKIIAAAGAKELHKAEVKGDVKAP